MINKTITFLRAFYIYIFRKLCYLTVKNVLHDVIDFVDVNFPNKSTLDGGWTWLGYFGNTL